MDSKHKTSRWGDAAHSTRYALPETCPSCGSQLKPVYAYVGVFPYVHTGVNLKCCEEEREFTFCFPFNPVAADAYTIFDSTVSTRYVTERTCPFHGVPLHPFRFLGDLVYTDGTRKMQLRCPICSFSERVVFNTTSQSCSLPKGVRAISNKQ